MMKLHVVTITKQGCQIQMRPELKAHAFQECEEYQQPNATICCTLFVTWFTRNLCRHPGGGMTMLSYPLRVSFYHDHNFLMWLSFLISECEIQSCNHTNWFFYTHSDYCTQKLAMTRQHNIHHSFLLISSVGFYLAAQEWQVKECQTCQGC